MIPWVGPPCGGEASPKRLRRISGGGRGRGRGGVGRRGFEGGSLSLSLWSIVVGVVVLFVIVVIGVGARASATFIRESIPRIAEPIPPPLERSIRSHTHTHTKRKDDRWKNPKANEEERTKEKEPPFAFTSPLFQWILKNLISSSIIPPSHHLLIYLFSHCKFAVQNIPTTQIIYFTNYFQFFNNIIKFIDFSAL